MIKDRIQKIIKAEKLTSTRFADAIGVQRSNISHILSGRNKPSLDFIQKVLTTFGNLNSDWLLFGRGTMYNDDSKHELFPQEKEEAAAETKDKPASSQEPRQIPEPEPEAEQEKQATNSADMFGQLPGNQSDTDNKKIVRIIIMFQDGTFREYSPS